MISKSHDVILPVDQRPQFPAKCPFTFDTAPSSHFTFITRDGGCGAAIWAGWFAVRVPVTPAGRIMAFRTQWCAAFRNAVMVSIVLGIVTFAVNQGVSGFWPGLGVFAIGCVVIIAFVVWEQSHPPSFRVFRTGGNVYYEFRNEAYAREFARLNGRELARPTSSDLE